MRFPCPVCGADTVEIVHIADDDPDTGAGEEYELIDVSCDHRPEITPVQWDALWHAAHATVYHLKGPA
jgi:hypothetical protein